MAAFGFGLLTYCVFSLQRSRSTIAAVSRAARGNVVQIRGFIAPTVSRKGKRLIVFWDALMRWFRWNWYAEVAKNDTCGETPAIEFYFYNVMAQQRNTFPRRQHRQELCVRRPQSSYLDLKNPIPSILHRQDATVQTIMLTSHFSFSSRLRPRAVPERAQGLQDPRCQALRRRGPRPELLNAQDAYLTGGERPRQQPEGVREHGRRDRGS
jgi:hypothetical protein